MGLDNTTAARITTPITTTTTTSSKKKMTVLFTKAVVRYKVIRRIWSIALVVFLSWNVWLNATHDSAMLLLTSTISLLEEEASQMVVPGGGGKQAQLSQFASSSSSTKTTLANSWQARASALLSSSKSDAIQSTTKRSPPKSHSAASSSNSLELGLSLPLEQDSFSACLLVKDDNDILNEWIAYHYHTLQLRTLIVATDPSSTTSPSSILQKWNTSTDLSIQEWTDNDYMPQFFLQGQYHLIPNFMSRFNNRTSTYMTETSNTNNNNNNETENAEDWDGDALEGGDEEEENEDTTMTVQDEAWTLHVNSHRFRQSTFVQKCAKMLYQQNKTWMTHIDTDEYLVLHPKVRQQDEWRKVPVDSKLGPSSLLVFLKAAAKTQTKALNYPCISMPRLLYGSVVTAQEDDDEEDDNTEKEESFRNDTTTSIPLETLRWKYHSNFDTDAHLNGRPKVIMDLSGVPSKSNFLRDRIYSIHRPALHLCRNMQSVTFEQKWKFPLTVNHYLGDWKRYSSRHDPRRTREVGSFWWLFEEGFVFVVCSFGPPFRIGWILSQF
jgi:hypothetical protein